MLKPEDFSKKYNTTYKQIHEEEFLDTVSTEDKNMFEESEILTGKNINGKINKFNNFGKKNKNKKYNTIKQRCITSFNRYIDNKIAEGKEEEIWDRIWESSKNGDFQFAKLLSDRMLGKEQEQVKLEIDDLSFTVKEDKLIDKKKKG